MAGICLLISTGQFFLARTGAKKYYWAVSYFLLGYFMVFAAVVHGGMLLDYPHFYGPHIVVSFFPGLSFFIYFRKWLYANERFSLRNHLIPGGIALIVMLPFLAGSSEMKQAAIKGYYEQGILSWREHLLLAAMLINFVYAGWLAYEARILYNSVLVHGRSIFALISICQVLTQASLLIIFLAYILASRNLEKYGLTGLMIAICVGYYFMQRAAHLSTEMRESVTEHRQERYRVSRLSGINVGEIEQNLRRVMIEEKIFTDFELTMPRLAAKLNLKPHQLSEYLNNHLKKKFNDFINDYRVEEAKNLLREDTEQNIMRISLAAGFNSKSAFNLIFRKYVGISPSRYREENLPKTLAAEAQN